MTSQCGVIRCYRSPYCAPTTASSTTAILQTWCSSDIHQWQWPPTGFSSEHRLERLPNQPKHSPLPLHVSTPSYDFTPKSNQPTKWGGPVRKRPAQLLNAIKRKLGQVT